MHIHDGIVFAVLSLPLVVISWRSLFTIGSHGFYRFFAWEGILWLAIRNWRYWFTDPAGLPQLISWLLLLTSGYLIVVGLRVFKKAGKIDMAREDKNLLDFEKTTRLIDTGIYKYIRHPLYASLLYLAWGIFFKHITLELLIIAAITSVFLYITARLDEKECTVYFGDQYKAYMTRSKMFLPFIF